MSLIFDNSGFLTPYSAVGSDLETFRRIFVENFGESTTRGTIFESYLAWLDAFRSSVCPTGFYQWLDGSFVTRKPNPNDLDIVTFLDTSVFAQRSKLLRQFAGNALLKNQKLDCYFVEIIASDHRRYFTYQSDKIYWLNQFSYTKRDPKTEKRYEKGFIQLNF